jgi:hypothetical protein
MYKAIKVLVRIESVSPAMIQRMTNPHQHTTMIELFLKKVQDIGGEPLSWTSDFGDALLHS